MSILVVISDLIFREKIAAAGRETGTEIYFARSIGRAREILAEHPCKAAIIDLHLKNEDPVEVGKALKSEKLVEEIYGYYSHVEVERGAAAEDAGFDEVMPRSTFVTRLPGILTAYPT